jgi:hypothetical protein
LGIGRASGSSSDTNRDDPAGVAPDSRVRVCATTRAVRARVCSRSATARRSRPDAASPARASARRALRTTAAASAAAVSASSANCPVIRRTSSLASPLRRRRFAAIDRTRRPAARERSRTVVRVAPPAARTRRTWLAMRPTALASNPESVGYSTSAATTVVSARTRLVLNTLWSTALAHNASLSCSTVCAPQRDVSFSNVVGCGTAAPSGMRQNRRQLIESVTSRHSVSNPSW